MDTSKNVRKSFLFTNFAYDDYAYTKMNATNR